MKDKIIELREMGLTYVQIHNELGCAISTVSYYCGNRQPEKHLRRMRERRKTKSCLYCGSASIKNRNKFCNIDCWKRYNAACRKDMLERGVIKQNKCIRVALSEKHGHKCSECGQLSIWNNKPLVLQVDHVDGNSDNNMESNLRLLCPNCHSQTQTFGGTTCIKNTKRNKYLRKYKNGE